jgi:hypothetical protein
VDQSDRSVAIHGSKCLLIFVFFCLLFNYKLKHFKIVSAVKSTIKSRKSHALKMFGNKSVPRGQLTVVINNVFIFLIFLSKKCVIFKDLLIVVGNASCFVEGMKVDNFQNYLYHKFVLSQWQCQCETFGL